MVAWDLRGHAPFLAETLPHPNFHLVFEKPRTTLNGVHTARFSRELKDEGLAFGIKFRPGAVRSILNTPASSLANRSIPATSFFPAKEITDLETLLLSSSKEEKDEEKIHAVEAFLKAHIAAPDPDAEQAAQLVQLIFKETEIRTVADLAAATSLNIRTLQRIFREYVGATPKWVIRRYRLHELMEQIHAGKSLNYAKLALDLGYFDQAHLIRDFRAIVGYSPAQYGKRLPSVRQ